MVLQGMSRTTCMHLNTLCIGILCIFHITFNGSQETAEQLKINTDKINPLQTFIILQSLQTVELTYL